MYKIRILNEQWSVNVCRNDSILADSLIHGIWIASLSDLHLAECHILRYAVGMGKSAGVTDKCHIVKLCLDECVETIWSLAD